MGIQPGCEVPAFPRGALMLCPQLCMGLSPGRYTEIGLLTRPKIAMPDGGRDPTAQTANTTLLTSRKHFPRL
jgi:hypothetical protein